VVAQLAQGWVDEELAQEFPDLALRCLTVDARTGRSAKAVRRRLAQLAGRITGGRVIHMRHERVPWAYRVFWRQVGMDPDEVRTPVEQMALHRLERGGLPSGNLVDDSITIATLETGVAITAFDAGRVDGSLGLRTAAEGEPLGGSGPQLPGRQIVIADHRRPLAVLGGPVAESRAVTSETTRMTIAAIAVTGVPEVSVEEALWTVTELLTTDGDPGPDRW
jgi:DNA/RNA-binding domain of Phe-tRNA-synthetase-like protein